MKRYTLITLLLAVALVLWAASPVFADEITITGEVTDSYQIVADDGQVYEVSESAKGDALMEHIGETVEAKGTLMEDAGVKTISISDFKVLEQ